ncbi:MAG: HDOD domain-containing protein [Gammaproteobacteria bacterium]|nr:HDOD domain-containing protein [Gammaproteobacteria bacterium]
MDLKSLVQNTRTLFSLPDVLICINQLIDDPNSQVNDLAETILCDAGLAARLLRLANSAYYKPQRRVETVSHAIILLGHRQVRDLVMTTVAVSIFKGLPPELVNMDRFWLHSIRCGSAARRLAQHRQLHETEHFFIAGLLHGIGKLVLYSQYPEHYREVLELAGEDELARIAAERRIFKFTYADVGAELLKSWRLYDHLHMAVAYHLDPSWALATYRLDNHDSPCRGPNRQQYASRGRCSFQSVNGRYRDAFRATRQIA